MRLKNLSNDGYHLTRHKFGDTPISYLFIETVIDSGVLSEAASGVVQAAVSKLQNFLTPGASSNLDTILSFVAPKGGGLTKVKELITKAGTLTTPVLRDKNWWQELFSTFNIIDKNVQQQLIQQTTQASGASAGSPRTSVKSTSQPQAQNTDEELQKAREETEKQQVTLRELLKNHTEAQKQSLARIKELQDQLAALKAERGMVESAFNNLALLLLNEADVKSNLRFVGNNLMRRIGHPSITPIQEVDWFKQFMLGSNKSVKEGFSDFFNNMRNLATNPTNSIKLKNDNERGAKLAIKHLSDYVTNEVEKRLQVANLTSKDVITTITEWNKLNGEKAKASLNGGTVPPELIERLKVSFDKLQRIVYALNPNLAKGTS